MPNVPRTHQASNRPLSAKVTDAVKQGRELDARFQVGQFLTRMHDDARSVQLRKRPGKSLGFSLRDFFFLAALLIAPGLGLFSHWSQTDSVALIVGLSVVSFVAYLLHSTDKNRARENTWRIPETTLHGCELLGGWPGAFVAQRRLRHKVSKVSYQVVFWLIVALHQYVAVDYLLDWRAMQSVRSFVQNQLES